MIDYNTCQWCKHSEEGYCINKEAFELEIDMTDFYERSELFTEWIKEGYKDLAIVQLNDYIENILSEGIPIKNPHKFNCKYFE